MKIRMNSQSLFVTFGISVLVLNAVFRSSIYTLTGFSLPGRLGVMNILAIICLFFMLFSHHSKFPQKLYLRKTKHAPLLLIIAVYVFLVFYSNYRANNDLGMWVLFVSIFPGMLLMVIIDNNIDFRAALESFLRITNIIMIVVFLIGIADYFLGGIVNEFIATYMSSDSWAQMIRTENRVYGFRMCTILGSPLMNAFYALVMLCLNSLYEKVTGKPLLKKWFLYVISLLTIILTGSRTGLLIAVAYILITELFEKLGFFKLILLIVVFSVVLYSDFFTATIGKRFELGFMTSSDLRFKLFQSFLNKDFGTINLLYGGGYNYSRGLTTTEYLQYTNFEYPALMFLFDYGIVATLLYYIVLYIRPGIILLKNKRFYAFITYSALFACLQTFNVTAQLYDFNLLISFIAIMICQLEYDKT